MASPSEPAPAPAADAKPQRLVSLDAYRGFIMLAMASGGLGFAQVLRSSWGTIGKIFSEASWGPLHVLPWLQHAPGATPLAPTPFWHKLAYQFDHVQWAGCGFWDLIQPSFMFMVGVAMPYSYASRQAKGDTATQTLKHVLLRSVILVLLGVFLSSNGERETHWTFVNVLSQIGLGYSFVFLLLGRGVALQLLALAGILGGYWAFFALHPLPGSDVNLAKLGITEAWHQANDYTGFLAHWNKNTNAAAAFDVWFLNLFPRSKPFEFNSGGYATLNFIPSMATMLFGLMAGELLRGPATASAKYYRLVLAGGICLALGMLLDQTVCPSVKRIWTPSWAIFSTGWTFWMLAAFYWLIDMQGFKAWSLPLVVVGMNSIAAYCMSQLLKPWARETLKTHLGQYVFQGTYFGHELFDSAFAPIATSIGFLAVIWLACLWLYRQKIFLKI